MPVNSKTRLALAGRNVEHARLLWPAYASKPMVKTLRELTTTFGFSIALGELSMIDSHWYVNHTGLVRLANRRRCTSIRVEPVAQFSDPSSNRWVFKAIVYKTSRGRGFIGYGDADPSNVSPLVRGAEMRVAETRAVNRALRKAYGIGLCSVEELGWLSRSSKSSPAPVGSNGSHQSNGSGSHTSQPRLRDQLCLLIRQHNLDPGLVKAYAADFCGTAELRDAGRDLVESFISRLANEAKQDRGALACKLNSYVRPTEVKS